MSEEDIHRILAGIRADIGALCQAHEAVMKREKWFQAQMDEMLKRIIEVENRR